MPSWLAWSLFTVVMWGLWGVMSKAAMNNVRWDEFYILSLPIMIALVAVLLVTRRPALAELSARQVMVAMGAYSLSLVGGLSMLLAVTRGKAAVVIPITATYPAMTAFLAYLLLGESLGARQQLGIVTTIIGVLLLSL